jgi:hypothetical protein
MEPRDAACSGLTTLLRINETKLQHQPTIETEAFLRKVEKMD